MSNIFDVIIPTYNNLSYLKLCLEGFNRQSFKNFRVIVCVDGSKDGTIEYLENAKFEYPLIMLKHLNNVNKGRDETRNLALSKINSKFLLFIDSDIFPSDDLILNHYELLKNNSCVSVGEVIYEDQLNNVWSYYLQTRGKSKYKNLDEIPSYYLNTQNVAFQSKFFLELGGQDSDLSKSYGGDDIVLGHRIEKKYGIPTIFNKKAVGFAKSEKSLDRALNQMHEFGRNNLKIIKRKYPDLNKIFNLNLMDSDIFYHRLFRIFLRTSISNILKKFINISPSPIKLYIIQFLVFNSIYQGYKST